MPEHVFTFVARGVSVDVQTNCVSVFSILEELRLPPGIPEGKAAIVPEVAIITLWRAGPDDQGVAYEQWTRLTDPQGVEVSGAKQSFQFTKLRQRVTTKVQLLPLRSVGCHRIEVYLRKADAEDWGDCLASFPLEVLSSGTSEDSDLLEPAPPATEQGT